ncbi:MAG TPA: ribosome recycling factor [Armatimonadota bacterium]|nr:ribosome recycling factor [Armatimonadota bacterium]
MISDTVSDAERRMTKAVEAAQHDYTTIRTGRANPALLERVTVEYYGTNMPVSQLGTISVPEPRLLVIAPWDKSAIPHIERAITKSDLGLTPASDGNVIRLSIPQLTEERRRELIKVLHKKAEDHRVAVRNVRRDANEELKRMEKAGEVSEDDVHRAQEQIQKLTDKCVEQIDRITAAKEAELMEV